jgi:hypothetical protein
MWLVHRAAGGGGRQYSVYNARNGGPTSTEGHLGSASRLSQPQRMVLAARKDIGFDVVACLRGGGGVVTIYRHG